MYLFIEVVLIIGAVLVAISAVVAVVRNSESGMRRQKAQRGDRK
jgi:NADH:ubiquinone oxidoreductase subunit 6 (subunit J)